MPYTLTLVRHGNSHFNDDVAKCLVDSEPQLPTTSNFQSILNLEGKKQMDHVGRFLRSERWPRHFKGITSNMVRARMSAGILGKAFEGNSKEKIQWRIDGLFRERHFGVHNDISDSIQLRLFLESISERKDHPLTWKPLDGEAFDDIRDRAWAITSLLSHLYEGDDILIVTHSWVIWALQYILDWMSPEEFERSVNDPKLRLGFGDIVQYSIDGPHHTDGFPYKWKRVVRYGEASSGHHNGWTARTGKETEHPTSHELLEGIKQYVKHD